MRVIFFSGGLASFAVAHHLITKYPNEKPLLYFTDTKWEDEDLYRFIYEVSDKLKLPMMIHSMNLNPVQLMIKQKIIYNSRMGNCSTILKMKTAADYFKRGKVPEYEEKVNWEYYEDGEVTELYFGIGYEEFHRVGAIKKNWQPFEVKFPLVETMYDYDGLLKLYGIEKPRLYNMGFTHNNCKGRCVKAGKGHFKLLYNTDRETFDEINQIEHWLSIYVGAYHWLKQEDGTEHLLAHNESEMNKWHDSGYTYMPKLHFAWGQTFNSMMKKTHLKEVKKQMDNKQQFDLFGNEEIGGCSCFIDYDEEL